MLKLRQKNCFNQLFRANKIAALHKLIYEVLSDAEQGVWCSRQVVEFQGVNSSKRRDRACRVVCFCEGI